MPRSPRLHRDYGVVARRGKRSTHLFKRFTPRLSRRHYLGDFSARNSIFDILKRPPPSLCRYPVVLQKFLTTQYIAPSTYLVAQLIAANFFLQHYPPSYAAPQKGCGVSSEVLRMYLRGDYLLDARW